jgi:hypothetical protein
MHTNEQRRKFALRPMRHTPSARPFMRWQVSRLADAGHAPRFAPLPSHRPVDMGKTLRSRSRGRLRFGLITGLSHSLLA